MSQVQKNYLILDLGSQHIKAGYAGEGYPRFNLPSVVGYKLDEADKILTAYDALYAKDKDIYLKYPFQEKTSSFIAKWDWNAAKELLAGVIKKLNINPSEFQVLYIEPLHANKRNTEELTDFLKKTFYFQQVFVYNQAHLTISEMQKQSGLVIELGHSFSSIIAYYKGYEIETSRTFFSVAGRLIADTWASKLKQVMKRQDKNFKEVISPYELVRLIDTHFYIAKNYEQEYEDFKRGYIKPIEVNLPFSARPITIQEERFTIPETIFRPQILGQDIEGLAQILKEAIMACPIDTRPEILENVIISGGLSKLKGLDTRIKDELLKLFPNLTINILAHSAREATAWIALDNLISNKKPDIDKRDIQFPLPEIVRQMYNEAVNCENAKPALWLATSTMIQTTVKAINRDLSHRNSSILNILHEFRQFGIINAELLEWANNLKILRNINAPPLLEQISQKRITEELDFLQALLEIIYKLYPKLGSIVKPIKAVD